MNLLNKFQDQYQKLWQYIIRPERLTYPQSALGPEVFTLEGLKVKRSSFQLVNQRGKVIFGSHFVPMEESQYPCVIYLHGNSSNQTQGMEYLNQLIRNGISLCTFDFSGCGNAEGDYVTLGYYQWMDVQEVYMHVKAKQKVNKIGIWGRSMGAVTALRYLKKNDKISVAVFDSPFSSLQALVLDMVKNTSKIPKLITSGALKIISGTIKDKADFSVYELNPASNQAPFITTPAFFIVASDDELIPPKHTKLIFDSYRGKKKQIRVVEGTHNTNRPQSTIKQVIKYLKKYLLKSPQTQNKQQKQIKMKNEKQIDFFNQDLLGDQQAQIPEQTKHKLEQIDFFANKQQQNTQKFDNPFQDEFDMEQFTKASQNLNHKQQNQSFKINDFFSGFLPTKNHHKNKKITDQFSELRSKTENLSKIIEKQRIKNQQYKAMKKKLQKQISHTDMSFQKQLEINSYMYVWG